MWAKPNKIFMNLEQGILISRIRYLILSRSRKSILAEELFQQEVIVSGGSPHAGLDRRNFLKLSLAALFLAACGGSPPSPKPDITENIPTRPMPTIPKLDIYHGRYPDTMLYPERIQNMITKTAYDLADFLGRDIPQGKILVMGESAAEKVNLVREMFRTYDIPPPDDPHVPAKPLLVMGDGRVYLDPYFPIFNTDNRYTDLVHAICLAHLDSLTHFRQLKFADVSVKKPGAELVFNIDGVQGLSARAKLNGTDNAERFILQGFQAGLTTLVDNDFARRSDLVAGSFPDQLDRECAQLVEKILNRMRLPPKDILLSFAAQNDLIGFVVEMGRWYVQMGTKPEEAVQRATICWIIPCLRYLGVFDFTQSDATLNQLLTPPGQERIGELLKIKVNPNYLKSMVKEVSRDART